MPCVYFVIDLNLLRQIDHDAILLTMTIIINE